MELCIDLTPLLYIYMHSGDVKGGLSLAKRDRSGLYSVLKSLQNK
jgi:hypothetical protein